MRRASEAPVARSRCSLRAASLARLRRTDLPKATEIEHMRVLGAKLEVVGDATRTTPKPGESVKVTFATVFPSQKRAPTTGVQSMLIGCTAPSRFTGGLPICQEFLDAANGRQRRQDVRRRAAIDGGRAADATASDLPDADASGGGRAVDPVPARRSGRRVLDVDPRLQGRADAVPRRGVRARHGVHRSDDPLLFGCDDDSGETHPRQRLDHGAARSRATRTTTRASTTLELVLGDVHRAVAAVEGDAAAEDDCEAKAQNDRRKIDLLTLPHADPGKHRSCSSYEAAAREKIDGVPEEPRVHDLHDRRRDGAALHAVPRQRHGRRTASSPATVDWDPPKPQRRLPEGGSSCASSSRARSARRLRRSPTRASACVEH